MNGFLEIGTGCQGAYWNTPNIQISTGELNVGEATTISVTVHNNGNQVVRLNEVQATICALNTIHGFNSSAILPSLQTSNPLSWENVFPFSSNDVQIGAGEQQTIPLPSWTPQVSDIHQFDTVLGAAFEDIQKTTLHVCVFANCSGSYPPSLRGQVTDDGSPYNWSQVDSSFCSDTHHAQHNTALHRLVNQSHLNIPFYAGIAGNGRLTNVKVSVNELAQSGEIGQLVLGEIQRAGLGSLPLHPSVKLAKLAGIARFHSILKQIEQGIEEVVDEVKESVEHLVGHKDYEDDESNDVAPQAVMDIKLKKDEIYPLLLKLEFDEAEPVGTVHVFDVIQVNPDQTHGGFRFITVSAP